MSSSSSSSSKPPSVQSLPSAFVAQILQDSHVGKSCSISLSAEAVCSANTVKMINCPHSEFRCVNQVGVETKRINCDNGYIGDVAAALAADHLSTSDARTLAYARMLTYGVTGPAQGVTGGSGSDPFTSSKFVMSVKNYVNQVCDIHANTYQATNFPQVTLEDCSSMVVTGINSMTEGLQCGIGAVGALQPLPLPPLPPVTVINSQPNPNSSVSTTVIIVTIVGLVVWFALCIGIGVHYRNKKAGRGRTVTPGARPTGSPAPPPVPQQPQPASLVSSAVA